MPNWKVLNSEPLLTAGIFKLRREKCELPDGRVMPSYYIFDFPDWVNVLPITKEGQAVMVEQYRHGAGEVFLEIPGGSTHSGAKEDPRLAAERELLEETGYKASDWIYCGSHSPNPALQGNNMHTYLALGCEKVQEPQLDPFEDLRVHVMDLEELKLKLQNGEIRHSLIAASMHLALSAYLKR